MVAARSVAMAFNRVLDADIDARNPRTEVAPSAGRDCSRARFAWGFIAVWALVFLFAARELNPLCFKLAPAGAGDPDVLFLHQALHVAFARRCWDSRWGSRPAAAWIAMRGSLDPRILWLTAAVTLWTAGFDIIYACQDYEFDVAGRPVQHPAAASASPGALWISRAAASGNAGRVCCCWSHAFALGALALAGVAAVAGLLLWEHRLVKADDLSRIDAAFFTMNGYVSVIFFVFWATDIFLAQSMTPVFEDPRLRADPRKSGSRRAPDLTTTA